MRIGVRYYWGLPTGENSVWCCLCGDVWETSAKERGQGHAFILKAFRSKLFGREPWLCARNFGMGDRVSSARFKEFIWTTTGLNMSVLDLNPSPETSNHYYFFDSTFQPLKIADPLNASIRNAGLT